MNDNARQQQGRRQARQSRVEEHYQAVLAGRRCPQCDGPMPRPKDTGRPRIWCSDSCRRAAARAARARGADSAEGSSATPPACPRCGKPLPPTRGGRPRTWCSDICRRAAGEERRAAAAGAIGVKIVEHERIVERTVERRVEVPLEHDLDECVRRALASPAACRRILRALADQARNGGLDDAKWSPVGDAADTLASYRVALRGRNGYGN